MISAACWRSAVPISTSSALLRCRYPKLSSELHRQGRTPAIPVNLSFSKSRVFDCSGFEKRSCWARHLHQTGIVHEPRKTVVASSGSRSSGPIPIPIGSATAYPLKGVLYLFQGTHRNFLWKRVGMFVAQVGAASVGIFSALAGFTFHAQRSALLHVLPQFFGTPGTIILLLIETAIPVGFVFYQRLQRVQDKIFEDVLHLENVQVERATPDERAWIDEQREAQWQRTQSDGNKPPSMLDRALAVPQTLNEHPLRRYFLTLPLNFIPIAGTVSFCWINAVDTAASQHHYYYKNLKGLSAAEEDAVVTYRKSEYHQFGLTASALTLVPGFDVVLVLTNSIGAALWAVDIEKAAQKRR